MSKIITWQISNLTKYQPQRKVATSLQSVYRLCYKHIFIYKGVTVHIISNRWHLTSNNDYTELCYLSQMHLAQSSTLEHAPSTQPESPNSQQYHKFSPSRTFNKMVTTNKVSPSASIYAIPLIPNINTTNTPCQFSLYGAREVIKLFMPSEP